MNSTVLLGIAPSTQNFISKITILKHMGDVVFEGIVTSGLGKGAVFISIDYYKQEIKNKLGFDAYPGTLNLTLDEEQTNLLKKTRPIRIESYKKDNRSFGGINCYKAKIKNIIGYIIVPDLTEHKDTIEFIAPVNLKSKLKIKDGDKVKIELEP
jgi:riboflavin kinase